MISLDAKTGKPASTFGDNGMVNLKPGVVPDKYPNARVGITSPPSFYKNYVFTGSSPGEFPTFGAAGDIRAWDMRTGKLVWTFHTLPRPGEANHEVWKDGQWEDRAGVNSWGFMTVDVQRGLVFVPIGTPNTDFYGGDRQGSNLYGTSLVALDANTGKLKWYFQTVHHDNWDYDDCSAPILITVKEGRKEHPCRSADYEEWADVHPGSRNRQTYLRRKGGSCRERQCESGRCELANPADASEAAAAGAELIFS